jgi:hypothetical protein
MYNPGNQQNRAASLVQTSGEFILIDFIQQQETPYQHSGLMITHNEKNAFSQNSALFREY